MSRIAPPLNVLLLARYRHHERYFATLARHSSLAMRVITLRDLPLLKPHSLRWLREAHSDAAIAYHTLSKSKKEPYHGALYWWLYRHINRFRAAVCYAQCKQLFATHRPDALVVWNGGTWFFRAAIQAAEEAGIQVFYAENGLLPNTVTLDPKGINFANSLPRTPDFYRQLDDCRNSFSNVLQPRQSARSLAARAVTLPARYLLVPLQVNTDSQILLNSPWLPDMYHLLDTLREIVPRLHDTDITFVIREHPSCRSHYDGYHQVMGSRFLFANGNPMQELIEGAEAVLTINSTAGIESLLLGKKVIVAGNAFYAIPELVLPVTAANELETALNAVHDWQPDNRLRCQFLTYLSEVYCIPGNREHVDELHLHRIDQRIRNVVEHHLPL